MPAHPQEEAASSAARLSSAEQQLATYTAAFAGGMSAASIAMMRHKMERMNAELEELGAEYSKVKFECALAVAEQNEMAGKLQRVSGQWLVPGWA